jgi:hypothetical protein
MFSGPEAQAPSGLAITQKRRRGPPDKLGRQRSQRAAFTRLVCVAVARKVFSALAIAGRMQASADFLPTSVSRARLPRADRQIRQRLPVPVDSRKVLMKRSPDAKHANYHGVLSEYHLQTNQTGTGHGHAARSSAPRAVCR